MCAKGIIDFRHIRFRMGPSLASIRLFRKLAENRCDSEPALHVLLDLWNIVEQCELPELKLVGESRTSAAGWEMDVLSILGPRQELGRTEKTW